MTRILSPILLPFLLLLGACSTTLKPTTLGKNGYFDTNSRIEDGGVKLEKQFKPEYKQLLYVKTDNKNKQFNTFFLQTFKNMKEFKIVRGKDDMEALVLNKGLADKVSSVSDKVGLFNLEKEIGPFLVVEPYAEFEGGFNYIATLKAYDPKTGKDVLDLENKAFNWSGLDKPLFYPLFNAFLEWVRGEKIETRKSPPPKST